MKNADKPFIGIIIFTIACCALFALSQTYQLTTSTPFPDPFVAVQGGLLPTGLTS